MRLLRHDGIYRSDGSFLSLGRGAASRWSVPGSFARALFLKTAANYFRSLRAPKPNAANPRPSIETVVGSGVGEVEVYVYDRETLPFEMAFAEVKPAPVPNELTAVTTAAAALIVVETEVWGELFDFVKLPAAFETMTVPTAKPWLGVKVIVA